MSISKETLEQRLRGHIGLAVSHPQFTGIVNDCYTAADEIDGLRAQLAEAQAEIKTLRNYGVIAQATIERMKPVVEEGIKHFRNEPNEMFNAVRDYEAKEPKP